LGAGIKGVVVAAADDIPDIEERIALRITAAAGAILEVDADRCRRAGVTDVIAGADTGHDIGPATAAQHRVAATGAGQDIGVLGADDVFDIDIRIADGPAAAHTRAKAGRQIDRDANAIVGSRITDRIIAGAAIENIGVGIGDERIVLELPMTLSILIRISPCAQPPLPVPHSNPQ